MIKSAKPILVIAFTNHALDHILTSVLDAGITNKIARLGGRSADERISQFSIEKLEVVAGQSRLDRTLARNHRELKAVEGEIKALMKNFTESVITPEEIIHYIETQYPDFSEHFQYPPNWVSIIHELSTNTEDDWQRVGRHNRDLDANDSSLYGFWMRGGDLVFLSAKPSQSSSENEPPSHEVTQDNKFSVLLAEGPESDYSSDEDEDTVLWQHHWGGPLPEGRSESDLGSDEDEDMELWQHRPILDLDKVTGRRLEAIPPPVQSPPPPSATKLQITDLQDPDRFFAAYGYQPQLPVSDRPLAELLERGAVWTLSTSERKRLHDFWSQEAREATRKNNLDEFTRLREKYRDSLEVSNEGRIEVNHGQHILSILNKFLDNYQTRRQLLKNVDIVACTTTGMDILSFTCHL